MSRLRLNNMSTPSTPAQGKIEIFADSSDKLVKQIDETGVVRKLIDGISFSLPAAVATSGTGENLLFKLAIPANLVAIGTAFNIWAYGNSSSTGTLIFRVRAGANGTTGDAQTWISTTSVAQVANARAGFEVTLTVRSIGAAGTVYTDGSARAGVVVLPTLIAAPAVANVTTSSLWYIDVTCTCSTGTFTCQNGTIEIIQ